MTRHIPTRSQPVVACSKRTSRVPSWSSRARKVSAESFVLENLLPHDLEFVDAVASQEYAEAEHGRALGLHSLDVGGTQRSTIIFSFRPKPAGYAGQPLIMRTFPFI